MTKEKWEENNTFINCKRSFKAIEGFLRRVAFNLGNTASQTEVKIISCIPIDVTELQLKIFELQKELEKGKHYATKDIPNDVDSSPMQTSFLRLRENICASCNAKQSNAEVPRFTSSLSCHDPGLTTKNQRSTISFLNPGNTSIHNFPYSEEITNTINKEKARKHKNFFSRRKKAPKKKKQKTHVIYYAKTDIKSPFFSPSILGLSDDMTSKIFANDVASKSFPLARSHFLNVVQKQYAPDQVLNNVSNFSEFSSPICRDTLLPAYTLSSRCDTSACSHDKFQNIDRFMNNRVKINLYPTCENYQSYNRNSYYDSNFYDVVPVREKPVKICQNVEIQKKKRYKKPATLKRLPKKYRTQPTVVNYCAAPLMPDNGTYNDSVMSCNRRDVLNPIPAERISKDVTNTRSVDFGLVYTKQLINDKQQVFPTTNNKCKVNFSSIANNAECQTSFAPAENPSQFKTETTLNQIKSMLQSVLKEVKISSKLNKPLPKKDAVVQNGPSQENMFGESQLLQNFTYSPFNINPYVASCSRQIPLNNFTYSGVPNRCLHQYPLLIEPQRTMCSNCFRNKHVAKSVNTYHAASAATNTEQNQRSKETTQLIKEIYKSIALNIELPSSEENTDGEYTKLKSTVKAPTNCIAIENRNTSKHMTNSIPQIFKNKNPGSTCTRNKDTIVSSKLTTNVTNTESEHATIISGGNKTERKSSYSQNVTSTTEIMDRELDPESTSQTHEAAEQSEDTEESSSQTESDDILVDIKKSAKPIDTKKEKNSLFNKVFKIFKPRLRLGRKYDIKEVENESESDSDDYQTIYSHKDEAPKRQRGIHIRNEPHTKVFYVNQCEQRPKITSPDRNPRTSPNVEEEYRRCWDEKLFHKMKGKRYSTETSRYTDTPRRTINSQNYEARSALVDRIKEVPLRMPGNVQVPQYAVYNRDISRNNNGDGGIRLKYPGNSLYYPGNSPYPETVPYSRNRPYYPGNIQDYSGNDLNYPGNSPNFEREAANYAGNKGHISPHYVMSKSSGQRKTVKSAIGAAWLKRHKLGIKCTREQWKRYANV